MLVYIFALALAQSDPAAAAPPVAPAASSPAALAAAEAEADTPKGAPAQDYDFVAWCHGALKGHMALYDEVKPELNSIERQGEAAENAKTDKAQMEAGREYLALYTRALNGVDKSHAGPLDERRKAAEAQGASIWTPARAADARTKMWSWLLWDLPGRCETAAKSLQTRAGMQAALHSPAPTIDAAASQASVLASDPTAGAAPAPAPANIDDALSTNPAGAARPAPPSDAAPPLRGPQ